MCLSATSLARARREDSASPSRSARRRSASSSFSNLSESAIGTPCGFRKIVCRPSNAVSRIIQRGDAVALAHPLSIQWRQRWWLRWLDRGDDSAPDTHDVVAVVTAQKDLRHVATALRTVDFHAVLFRFTENGGAPQRDSHGLGGHVSCRKRCLVLNSNEPPIVFPSRLSASGGSAARSTERRPTISIGPQVPQLTR
jgi:hypothetical protein